MYFTHEVIVTFCSLPLKTESTPYLYNHLSHLRYIHNLVHPPRLIKGLSSPFLWSCPGLIPSPRLILGVLIRRSISLHRNLFPITLKSYVIDLHPELMATMRFVLNHTYASPIHGLMNSSDHYRFVSTRLGTHPMVPCVPVRLLHTLPYRPSSRPTITFVCRRSDSNLPSLLHLLLNSRRVDGYGVVHYGHPSRLSPLHPRHSTWHSS